jgi:sulfate transport system ATP-binding protein
VHVTSLFVTHDQEEALEVADRVVIMNHGRIEQVGTPEEVYSQPASPFVLDFLGDVNLFRCRIEQGRIFVGDVPIAVRAGRVDGHGDGTAYIRPHALAIEVNGDGRSTASVPARVVHINPAGPVVKVELVTPWGDDVRVDVERERFGALALSRGSEVFLRPTTDDIIVVSGDATASRAS